MTVQQCLKGKGGRRGQHVLRKWMTGSALIDLMFRYLPLRRSDEPQYTPPRLQLAAAADAMRTLALRIEKTFMLAVMFGEKGDCGR